MAMKRPLRRLSTATALLIISSAIAFGSVLPAASGVTDPPSGVDAPYSRPADPVLRDRLSPIQYRVTQQDATEPPFDNPYWDEQREGIYVDVVSGEPLFSSRDKFDSGTGWPSFTRPIHEDAVVTRRDFKLLIPRMEVRSQYGDSHLGHVFRDGPAPTGLRYCMNSAALKFVPKNRLAAEGYGEYLSLFENPPPF